MIKLIKHNILKPRYIFITILLILAVFFIWANSNKLSLNTFKEAFISDGAIFNENANKEHVKYIKDNFDKKDRFKAIRLKYDNDYFAIFEFKNADYTQEFYGTEIDYYGVYVAYYDKYSIETYSKKALELFTKTCDADVISNIDKASNYYVEEPTNYFFDFPISEALYFDLIFDNETFTTPLKDLMGDENYEYFKECSSVTTNVYTSDNNVVLEGAVPGLYTIMESYLELNPDGTIVAAYIRVDDSNNLNFHYFSNSEDSGTPTNSASDWLNRFDYPVIFENDK